MSGRYGTDQLGRLLMGIAVVTLILYIFFQRSFFYIITIFCIVVYYYRSMSRNCSRRYEENLKYLQIRGQIAGRFRLSRTHMEQRKIYRFYTCPSCRQKIRVPKGKGKISITCPRCHAEFIRKT